jgi:hypothetical protein
MVTKEQNTFFNVIKQARAFLSLGIKSTFNASMIDVKHLLRLWLILTQEQESGFLSMFIQHKGKSK